MRLEVENDPIKKDRDLAHSIHTVECEFGCFIDEDYNYIKMLSQFDYLAFKNSEYKKQQLKNKHK